ncbi:MAG: AAA family ATPase [Candidatus Margulisbacteria bacterium]|jgi:cellulose biosynthesis protein BcsQ|nr:AAA family ATPase [Candidatus Margulisiibacteriota bacterium]
MFRKIIAEPGTLISVIGGKGGGGKTAVSVLLGYGLAQQKERVVVVNYDLGNSSLNKYTNMEPDPRHSTGALRRGAGLADAALSKAGADFILGSADIEDTQAAYNSPHSYLNPLMQAILHRPPEYRYTIVDLQAGSTVFTVRFALLADVLLSVFPASDEENVNIAAGQLKLLLGAYVSAGIAAYFPRVFVLANHNKPGGLSGRQVKAKLESLIQTNGWEEKIGHSFLTGVFELPYLPARSSGLFGRVQARLAELDLLERSLRQGEIPGPLRVPVDKVLAALRTLPPSGLDAPGRYARMLAPYEQSVRNRNRNENRNITER